MDQSERHRQARFDALAFALAQELRNPLSTITMTLELLREELSGRPDGAAPAVRRVDAVLDELKRLDRVFAEFLRFAHAPEPELEASDVNRLIEDALGVLAGDLKARNVTPVLQLDRRGPPVLLDQRLFRQAVVNLIGNVIETLRGGTLTVQTRVAPSGIEVDVIDTGANRPAEPRVFDSFFTSLSGRGGVGLALTRQIVELHGGRIAYEAGGAGRRFRITLPAARGGR